MPSKILFVDDDPNILSAFRRNLRGEFDITAVSSPDQALETLGLDASFSVIVSDFKMPKMNGVEFLSQASAKWPNIVRILLTGEADTKAAVAAVNRGHIYRFLMKPLALTPLSCVLNDAVKQHNLIVAEKELLERTLSGTMNVLTEILGLLRPFAFSRTSRIRQSVSSLVACIGLSDTWEFDVAAMLSLLGCIGLPDELLRKMCDGIDLTASERTAFEGHPSTGARLLANIPRLGAISKMIGQQEQPLPGFPPGQNLKLADRVLLGSYLLKIANEFDLLIRRGATKESAIQRIRGGCQAYPPELLAALENLQSFPTNRQSRGVLFRDLAPGMVPHCDILATDGSLLLAKGNTLTSTLIECLSRYSHASGIREPIEVLCADLNVI